MTAVTVATLNLRNRQDRWLARRELIVAQLIDARPDLLSLQEVYMPIGQARWLRHQINARLSGSTRGPYQLVQARKRHWIKGYLEGVAILSRLPIVSSDVLGLGYDGRVALRANLELPSGATVDFVAVHLHHVPHDRQARLEQVMRLTGWLSARAAAPFQVLAGDFNETPDGPAIRQMKQTYRSAFSEARGHEPLATFPTALRGDAVDWAGCLDYIFVSPPVHRVLDARLFCHQPDERDDTLYPSDHVGLIATVAFEPPGRR